MAAIAIIVLAMAAQGRQPRRWQYASTRAD
jgi:hypothetical protein